MTENELPIGRITPEDLTRLFRPDGKLPLGQGSYAKVFKVFHLASGKLFALKIVEKVSPEVTERTLDEIESVMAMDHPNICKIHCYAEDDKAIYIIMDLIDGCDFLQFLKQYPEILLKNLKLLWKIVEHLIAAIDYIHSIRGVVHCDIKLQNIMVEISDSVVQYIKLIDFGFCKDVSDVALFNGGTSNYMAPEILLRCSKGFGRDIWAFGITLFALLTGNFPSQLESKNPDDEQRKKEVRKKLRELGRMSSDQQFDPFLDPLRDYSAIPDEVKTFIRSCLVVDQASRPTAAVLKRRVQEILSRFDAKSEA
jgi:serine/threonine protein kinase